MTLRFSLPSLRFPLAPLTALTALAVFAVLGLLSPSTADAQWRLGGADAETLHGDLPNTFTERPLTLPQLTLRMTAGATLSVIDPGGANDYAATVGGGFAFGIIDDIEIGLGMGPIPSHPGVVDELDGLSGDIYPSSSRGFNPPYAYARFRFAKASAFELGLEAGFIAPVDGTDPGVAVSLPIRLRATQAFAIDVAVGTMLFFNDGDIDGVITGTFAPRFAAPVFYASVQTGFVMFTSDVEFTYMPMFFEFGITADPGRHLVDIFGRGGFPALILPGSSGDKINTDLIEATFGVRFYFDMDR